MLKRPPKLGTCPNYKTEPGLQALLFFFLSYSGWHTLPSHARAGTCLTGSELELYQKIVAMRLKRGENKIQYVTVFSILCSLSSFFCFLFFPICLVAIIFLMNKDIYQCSIITMALLCRFRDNARKLVEHHDFSSYNTCIRRPLQRGPHSSSEQCHKF